MAASDEDTKKRAAIRAQFPVEKPLNDDDPVATLAWLKSQNRVHALLLERMPFPVTVTDHQGKITYANPEAAKLFGRPQRLLRDLDVMELLKDPEGGNLISEIRLTVAAGKDVIDSRVAVELPNRDLVYAQLSIASLLEEGVQVRVVGFLRNLTEIERANRSLEAAMRREKLNRPVDPDTYIFTRRAFLERVAYQRVVANDIGYPLALVYVLIGGSHVPKEAVVAVVNSLRAAKGEAHIISRVAPESVCLLAPGAKKPLPELIERVRRWAMVQWTDEGGHVQLPLRIACDGERFAAGQIPEAEDFLEHVEKKAMLLRRDSGTFPVGKREPS